MGQAIGRLRYASPRADFILVSAWRPADAESADDRGLRVCPCKRHDVADLRERRQIRIGLHQFEKRAGGVEV